MPDAKVCFIKGKRFGEALVKLQKFLDFGEEAISRLSPLADVVGMTPRELFDDLLSNCVMSLELASQCHPEFWEKIRPIVEELRRAIGAEDFKRARDLLRQIYQIQEYVPEYYR